MVRDASLRKAKYEAKTDADVVRARILAQKDSMVMQMESKSAELASLETEVKRLLEGQTTPIYGAMMPQYLNVARQLYKLSKKFGATTFEAEAQLVLTKWATRGLLPWAINLIAEIFGSSYTPPAE